MAEMVIAAWVILAMSACGFTFAVGRLMPPQTHTRPRAAEVPVILAQVVTAPTSRGPNYNHDYAPLEPPASFARAARAAEQAMRVSEPYHHSTDRPVRDRAMLDARHSVEQTYTPAVYLGISTPVCKNCSRRAFSVVKPEGWWCSRCEQWIVKRPDSGGKMLRPERTAELTRV